MGTQKHILVESNFGLHCLNLENGEKLWAFINDGLDTVIHGLTSAVDQTNNLIYYQANNKLYKINALNGSMIAKRGVAVPNKCASGNTILVDDGHGYHILTYWYDNFAYSGTIRCYDIDLILEWEVTGLNTTYKNVLCYHDGFVYTGTGDNFGGVVHEYYAGLQEDCRVIAYDITDGHVEWTAVLSSPANKIYQEEGYGILQCIYCNGYLIVAQESARADCPTKILLIDISDGSVVRSYEAEDWSGACGHPAFSYGRLYKGDLNTNSVLVWQIGTGAKDDFAPFGTHKTNDDNAPDTALATIDANITAIGSVANGNQGIVIKDGIVYANKGSGVVAFDVDTLAVIKTYVSGTSWDSSPMVIENIAEEDILLIKENANKRVIALDVVTGDQLWVSDADMEGNLFFGFNYFVSSFIVLIGGMASAEILTAINDNFTILNALIANAATIITITSAVQWDDINANIASLNTFGVAVDVETITIGMTGQQFNDIINNFVIAFNSANS